MKIQWKKLFLFLAIPLAVGGLSALISGGGMKAFQALEKPAFSPPGWLFPVAWTVLYLLMGLASYLVFESTVSMRQKRQALTVYGLQLAVNFFWSIIFFNSEAYLLAFLWLLLLWGLIMSTLYRFYRITPAAGWLLVPYLLWVTFAGYLNLGIYLLN